MNTTKNKLTTFVDNEPSTRFQDMTPVAQAKALNDRELELIAIQRSKRQATDER